MEGRSRGMKNGRTINLLKYIHFTEFGDNIINIQF